MRSNVIAHSGSLSVCQIGSYPPPIGGVSIHIMRLHLSLMRLGIQSRVLTHNQNAYHHPNVSLSEYNLRWFKNEYWLLKHYAGLRADIIHCHNPFYHMPILYASSLRNIGVVCTVHDSFTCKNWKRKCPPIRCLLTRLAFKSSRFRWIAVNTLIKEQLIEQGVEPQYIEVIPAYLPPAEFECEATLDAELVDFMESHSPNIGIYGYRAEMHNGHDMYGFDMALESVHHLLVDYRSVGLLIVIPSNAPTEYIQTLRSMVADYDLSSSVLFYTKPLINAPNLWRRLDVYFRPSCTDGDAILVRECLSMGTRVVASDCVDRPEGTSVFRSRDVSSSVKCLQTALSQPAEARTQPDHLLQVLDVYNGLTAQVKSRHD